MKKKFLACILTSCMVAGLLVGCTGSNNPAPSTGGDTNNGSEANNGGGTSTSGKTVINVMSFTDEIPGMIDYYLAHHPEFAEKYEVNTTIKATDNGAYNTAMGLALANGEVDIYGAESAFVLRYTQGEMANFAATYKELGIDVDAKIKEADIASYTVDLGTRPSDGEVVGLGYQATGGAMIYRRSIAKEVWGDDSPETVKAKVGGGSGSWDQFWVAADELKAKGYKIVSGDGDMWHAIENSSDKGWVEGWDVDPDNETLIIDPKREALMDVSKTLTDKQYSNLTKDWSEAWYFDMKTADGREDAIATQKAIVDKLQSLSLEEAKADSDVGADVTNAVANADDEAVAYQEYVASQVTKLEDQEAAKDNKPVFAFFGPAWLINYVMAGNSGGSKPDEGTYGDWGVCESPIGFFWGGTWVLAGKGALEDPVKTEGVKTLIEWITLDSSNEGLQYLWANGMYGGTKDTVASGTVMAKSNGELDFLGGQNMFDVFVPANAFANGKNLTPYDEDINTAWRDQVRQYASGKKERDAAVEDFAKTVKANLGLK